MFLVNHDIIVVGASAGGVEVLLELVPELPADLPASIFIAVHTQPGYVSALPELLTRRGHLKAGHPVHGDPIERGHIYIAPPDNQLLVRPGLVEVVRGPKENGHRPAVDALFRTASWAYGARVIGVVLSGYQDCGTAGMMSIKARGGIAVVQSPESALASDMPRSVLARVQVDHVAEPIELPGLLARLARQPVPEERHAANDTVAQLEGDKRGVPAQIVCPLCNGVMTETNAGGFEHFRCHVGHTFSLDSLAREQSEELERALWASVRALEEGEALARRSASAEASGPMKLRFAEKAATLRRQADLLRGILLRGEVPAIPPPQKT